MVDITGPYLCIKSRLTLNPLKRISKLFLTDEKYPPERYHKAQTMEQQEVLNFLALQSTLVLTNAQHRVSYTPA